MIEWTEHNQKMMWYSNKSLFLHRMLQISLLFPFLAFHRALQINLLFPFLALPIALFLSPFCSTCLTTFTHNPLRTTSTRPQLHEMDMRSI